MTSLPGAALKARPAEFQRWITGSFRRSGFHPEIERCRHE